MPAPTFSVNGSNAAKSTTVTFGAVGTYDLMATIADAGGLSVASSVTVTASPTFTSVAVSPATVNVEHFSTQTFTAAGSGPIRQPLGRAAESCLDGQFGHNHGQGPFHRSADAG